MCDRSGFMGLCDLNVPLLFFLGGGGLNINTWGGGNDDNSLPFL